MRITRTLGATGIALGLTLTGAGVASAAQTADDWSPLRWAQQTTTGTTETDDTTDDSLATGPGRGAGGSESRAALGDGTGHGYGMLEGGTGDPTTCPYADDATADQDRDRLRDRDADGTPSADRDQQRQRMHATS